jgi:hypothetical protein
MDLLREIERIREDLREDPDMFMAVRHNILRALCDAAEANLQPDLFAVPHQKSSATSAEAARKWRPKAKSAGMKALKTIANAPPGGLTREEMCRYNGMKESTACGRLKVLKDARLIQAIGKKESDSGYPAEIYFVTDKGRMFLAAGGVG